MSELPPGFVLDGPPPGFVLDEGGKPSLGVEATALDIAKSTGSGVARGGAMMVGLGGDLSKVMGAGLQSMEKGGAPVEQQRSQMLEAMPSWLRKYHEQPAAPIGSKEIMGAVDKAAGAPVMSYEPQTRAGKVGRTIGEFLPAAMMGGGGLLRGAIAPGAASELAGQLTEGSKLEPYARIAGAVGGSFAPDLARRLVTPLPTQAPRMGAVETLRNEGVTDLTAGQITGRKPLQYLEAERGRGANLIENQGEQFTAAALRRVGENANRATPEVVDQAFNRIGGEFDRLAAGNTMTADRQLATGVRGAVDDYNNLVSPPNRTPAVMNFVNELATAVQRNNGNLPGEVYQSLRSRMERAARGMGNNPEARTALREIRETIDEAMERSIARSGNQADLGAWREARNQYRNLLVIERAATGAGEGAAAGLISPAKLRESTVNTQGRRNYARGNGEFSELARAGVHVMSPLPNSGTPGRLSAQNLGMGLSSIAGGLIGGGAGAAVDPVSGGVGGAAGMLAGALLPRAAGRLSTSRAGRAYLSNQLLPGVDQGGMSPAAIAAILSARTQLPDVRR
jgi:hypothetical protein